MAMPCTVKNCDIDGHNIRKKTDRCITQPYSMMKAHKRLVKLVKEVLVPCMKTVHGVDANSQGVQE